MERQTRSLDTGRDHAACYLPCCTGDTGCRVRRIVKSWVLRTPSTTGNALWRVVVYRRNAMQTEEYERPATPIDDPEKYGPNDPARYAPRPKASQRVAAAKRAR